MLHKGNRKLGKLIWTFSIPAATTCPGKSSLCVTHCYARRDYFATTHVGQAHARNRDLSRRRSFASRMAAEVARRKAEVVRIHVAGDFYSAAYVRRWLGVVRACPDTVFFAYTRSWRVPGILPALRELALEPNVRLWFSWDRETGPPPRARRVRRAYMAADDADVPTHKTHLTLRVRRRGVMKFDGSGAQVCPVEQGVERKVEITCTSCRLCWRDNAPLPRSPDRREALLPVLR